MRIVWIGSEKGLGGEKRGGDEKAAGRRGDDGGKEETVAPKRESDGESEERGGGGSGSHESVMFWVLDRTGGSHLLSVCLYETMKLILH